MKNEYIISGDKTGITYGVHKVIGPGPFDTVMVKGGIKTFKEAQKAADELRKKDKENDSS